MTVDDCRIFIQHTFFSRSSFQAKFTCHLFGGCDVERQINGIPVFHLYIVLFSNIRCGIGEHLIDFLTVAFLFCHVFIKLNSLISICQTDAFIGSISKLCWIDMIFRICLHHRTLCQKCRRCQNRCCRNYRYGNNQNLSFFLFLLFRFCLCGLLML